MSDPNVVGFTFARGGSKGIPGKNLRRLGRESLVHRAVRQSLASRWVSRHVVSTDDEEIAAAARDAGAEVPFMRPEHLASDTAAEVLSWKHAIGEMRARDVELDVFLSVPTTAPLRHSADIDRAVQMFLDTSCDLVITVTEASHNPYFNMIEMGSNGEVSMCISNSSITRRQDAPLIYGITTVAYVARPEFVLECESLFDGDTRAVVVPPERAIDVDTDLDLDFAEFLMGREASE